MKNLTTLLLLFLAYSCSSNQNELNANFPSNNEMEEKVISRIDGLTSRPAWFQESEAFKVEDGNVVSLGTAVIPGDHRIDAAIRIAQNNAKVGICSSIEQRLDFIFQNAQEGTAMDSAQTHFIGAEACKMTTTSLRNGKIYWEKVVSRKDSGEKYSSYKVFATVQMKEEELKKAIIDAVSRRAGKGGLSKDFAEKVNQHWDQFTKSENQENSEI